MKLNFKDIIYIVAIALGVFLVLRNNALQNKVNDINFKVQKEFLIEKQKEIIKSINVIDVKLSEVRVNTVADSISRFELLKKYEKPYQANLSHNRLLAIRDSLRKLAK